jgi:hypothetical protein
VKLAVPGAGLYLVFFSAALALAGCEQPGGTVPGKINRDSNARLEYLGVSAGYLQPAFDAALTAYRVTVNHAVDSITATAVPSGVRAAVSFSGEMPRSLQVGDNAPVVITVTAEDGTTNAYTIMVRRLDGSVIPVESADELARIGLDAQYPLAGDYRLVRDLELENWTPIGGDGLDPDGAGENPQNPGPFSGSFDGGGFRITLKNFDSAVFADRGGALYLGIFGYTRGNGTVKALIENLVVRPELNHVITKTGDSYAGALVGCAGEYTELNHITVEGSLDFSNENTSAPRKPVYVGGVAGALIASELKNSRVSADIRGFGRAASGSGSYVGGMVGMFDRNAVTRGINSAPVAGAEFAGSSIINCHTAGSVTGETEGSGSNVFVGGIAGGAWYGMKTYYSGKIEDCSSTGNISARGGAYWSWAGGIAGTISGDGHDRPNEAGDGTPVTGPTRVVRSYAAGTVTAEGAPGSWPSAGGIVGYNYYGGLISRCWFNGVVETAGTGINDYTGGIAGCNSKQYNGHSSRIADCWSAGTVRGNLNAGGITGQNQVAAVTERCYSTASVSVRAAKDAAGRASQQGAGGIAGYNAPADDRAAGTVRNCAALNPAIVSGGGFDRVFRVAGDGGGVLGNNRARADMSITIGDDPSTNADPGDNAKDGADCAALPDQAVYISLGWDFTDVWKTHESGYPVLRWQD